MSGYAIAWLAYTGALLAAAILLCSFLPRSARWWAIVALPVLLLMVPWWVVDDTEGWLGPAVGVALFDLLLGSGDASRALYPIQLTLTTLVVLALTAGILGYVIKRWRASKRQ